MNDDYDKDNEEIKDNIDDVEFIDINEDVVDFDEEFDFDDIEIDDDIIIEIDDKEDDIVLSKHKIEGAHSLSYDTIFKGKKDVISDDIEQDYDYVIGYQNDNIEVDKTSNYHHESIENESYIRNKLLKEKVYNILKEKTNVKFNGPRRRPSKLDFNTYYNTLKINLETDKFSNIELFNELSFYFSDNLFNMFKLLDNNWRDILIEELQEHIGKKNVNTEVKNRNITVGTEIEFLNIDDGYEKYITGSVTETHYDTNSYVVFSYERYYDVNLSDISKILNNTKFKYNLNKLNDIDFL